VSLKLSLVRFTKVLRLLAVHLQEIQRNVGILPRPLVPLSV